MSYILTPFQLLELNVISAQDLASDSRKMRTYAVVWVHPERKLSTRVDPTGRTNPTWNDKFVFRVDEEFLRNDTSAVMVEIYAVNWFRDALVGTVRILVGNLIPPPTKRHHHRQIGTRFVALQVRRPSGRPQGILNIGVTLLDSSMRSMPLYSQLSSSALGYRNLMGEEDPIHFHGGGGHYHNNHNNNHSNNNNSIQGTVKPCLRRSRSDRSELERIPALEKELSERGSSIVNGSRIGPKGKVVRSRGSSLVNGSGVGAPKKGKKVSYSTPSSLINESEVGAQKKGKKGSNSKSSSLVNGLKNMESPKKKEKKGKPSSVVGELGTGDKDTNKIIIGSDDLNLLSKKMDDKNQVAIGSDPPKKTTHERQISKMSGSEVVDPPKEIFTNPKPSSKENELALDSKKLMSSKSPYPKYNDYEYKGTQKVSFIHPSILSSDVGPSPSEVAAALAKEEAGSSVMDGWSLDESVEGLKSKLERWKTELPPVYDLGEFGSFRSTGSRGHSRRHTDGGGGLFSCFGNVNGYEISCICGKPTGAKKAGPGSGRIAISPSMEDVNRLY